MMNDASIRPNSRNTLAWSELVSSGWRAEAAPTSFAELGVPLVGQSRVLRLDYTLAGSLPGGQFAALAVETPGGVGPYDRLGFTVRAEQPMRISVHARVAVSPSADDSWSRSVYVDTSDRAVTVALNDMTAIGVTRTAHPSSSDIHSILFVVEPTNTRPGSSGRLWIARAELQR